MTTAPCLHHLNGQATKIVELPFRRAPDDAPFFQYCIALPGRTMQAPSALLEAWALKYDVLKAEERMMMVAMHPRIIGQPSCLATLEGLIRHALEAGDTRIDRCDTMVEDLRPGLTGSGAAA